LAQYIVRELGEFLQRIYVQMCERVRVERSGVNLRVDFVYDYCRRGEKVKKVSDGNIVREGGNGKEDGDNCIWVLTRDDDPDFEQIETGGTQKQRNKSQEEGE